MKTPYKAGSFYRRIKPGITSNIPVTVGKVYQALWRTTKDSLYYINDRGYEEISNVRYSDYWEEVYIDMYQIY